MRNVSSRAALVALIVLIVAMFYFVKAGKTPATGRYSAAGSRLGHDAGEFEAPGIRVKRLAGRAITGMAWSPDGKLLAVGSRDRKVYVYSPESDDVVFVYSEHSDEVYDVAWLADGQEGLVASAGKSGAIRVWDPKTGNTIHVFRGHVKPVSSLALVNFDSGYKPPILASGGVDGRVNVWDLKTGKHLNEISGHQENVYAVAWVGNNALLSAEQGGTISLWGVIGGKAELIASTVKHRYGDRITSLATNPETQTVASGSHDGGVYIWTVSTHQFENPFSEGVVFNHGGPVTGVTWLSLGTLASVGSDARLKLWSTYTRGELLSVSLDSGATSVAARPLNGLPLLVAIGTKSGRVFLVDPVAAMASRFKNRSSPALAPNDSLTIIVSRQTTTTEKLLEFVKKRIAAAALLSGFDPSGVRVGVDGGKVWVKVDAMHPSSHILNKTPRLSLCILNDASKPLKLITANDHYGPCFSASDYVAAVKLSQDRFGREQIHLALTPKGSKEFADFTRENIGRQVVFLLDGKPIYAPTIRSSIPDGRIFIADPENRLGEAYFRAIPALYYVPSAGLNYEFLVVDRQRH